MSSFRRRRLPVASSANPPATGSSVPRLRDGDRRRRGADNAKLAQKLKATLREWNLDAPGPQHLPDTTATPGSKD